MKRFLVVVMLYLLLSPLMAYGYIPSTNSALARNIESIINRYNPSLNIGIHVYSINDKKTIYQRNTDQLFMPASSLKTFTAAAALSYLGVDYKFQTKILVKPYSIRDHVLHGDVYLSFGGDPTLTRQDLAELIAVLSNQGVQRITGNIYIDDTVFTQSNFGPGWMWDERNLCYAAPSSAIAIDHNCFPLTIAAAKGNGVPLTIYKYKEYSFINIINHARTLNVPVDECPLDMHGTEDNTYYISGCLHPGAGSLGMQIAVRNVRLFAQNIINDLLRQSQISVDGGIRVAPLPQGQLVALAIRESDPLSELVKVMLKKSDNLIANAVYKKLGNAVFAAAGNWRNGAKAVSAILSNGTGINFKKLSIVDGCGLSRYNMVTPRSLVALLNYVYFSPNIREQFMAALPIAGTDGHLQYRMGAIKGRVRAKTGTMSNITSLVGYVFTNSNQVLSFAIMINGFVENPRKYQQLEDDICRLLVRL
jgi:serine-type D-Ala-D-Ala carboxypeptidase/endopeptidase (penicillin-binding protein 4)